MKNKSAGRYEIPFIWELIKNVKRKRMSGIFISLLLRIVLQRFNIGSFVCEFKLVVLISNSDYFDFFFSNND